MAPTVRAAKAKANLSGSVVSYTVKDPGDGYVVRPFAMVDVDSLTIATAQAMLNDDGQVVRLVHGPVPLWGTRRGEDVMLTDALAFDLRVYDPGAPVFATVKTPGTSTTAAVLDVVVTPSDPGWRGSAPDGANGAYFDPDNMKTDGSGAIGSNASAKNFLYVGQGAYVDLGYGYDQAFQVDQSHYGSPGVPYFPKPKYFSNYASSIDPWFFARCLCDVYDSEGGNSKSVGFGNGRIDNLKNDYVGADLAPGYCVYDTWSTHYENNGVNEDGYWSNGQWNWFNPATSAWQPTAPAESWRKSMDQGTDGLDNDGQRGVDDVHERETIPPYDKPLRGMQVLIRSYERDSRSIRQVRVNQHFMAE